MSQLEPHENMALTIALAQLERGESPGPNVSAVLIWALARITHVPVEDTP